MHHLSHLNLSHRHRAVSTLWYLTRRCAPPMSCKKSPSRRIGILNKHTTPRVFARTTTQAASSLNTLMDKPDLKPPQSGGYDYAALSSAAMGELSFQSLQSNNQATSTVADAISTPDTVIPPSSSTDSGSTSQNGSIDQSRKVAVAPHGSTRTDSVTATTCTIEGGTDRQAVEDTDEAAQYPRKRQKINHGQETSPEEDQVAFIVDDLEQVRVSAAEQHPAPSDGGAKTQQNMQPLESGGKREAPRAPEPQARVRRSTRKPNASKAKQPATASTEGWKLRLPKPHNEESLIDPENLPMFLAAITDEARWPTGWEWEIDLHEYCWLGHLLLDAWNLPRTTKFNQELVGQRLYECLSALNIKAGQRLVAKFELPQISSRADYASWGGVEIDEAKATLMYFQCAGGFHGTPGVLE